MEFEHRPSDSPYVERVWSSSGAAARMRSIAYANWELVVWEDRGHVHVAVRGPETSPSTVEVGAESASFGIVFAHGAAMPHLPLSQLVNSGVVAPHATAREFAMQGEVWELPTFDTAEDFVNRLVRSGVLVRDPLVSDAVAGEEISGLSARSVQRRVVTATGLTQGLIRQIERARQAAVLLGEGVTAADVVHRVGYYDQPHMARSLQRFLGRTATELQEPDESEPLSLLYKIED